MQAKLPESKWQRSVLTGKTAAAVGGKMLNYLAKKPFLSKAGIATEKKRLESDSAKTIFQALVLLKGTALKNLPKTWGLQMLFFLQGFVRIPIDFMPSWTFFFLHRLAKAQP